MPWSSRANYGSLEKGEGDHDQCQKDSDDDKRIEKILFVLCGSLFMIILDVIMIIIFS